MLLKRVGGFRLFGSASECGTVLHRAVCGVFLLAFVAIGAPIVFRDARAGYPLPRTPYSSTDAYLTKVQPDRALSGTLVKLFAAYPHEAPVLVLYPGEDFEGSFVAQLMAYLAWPHPVQLLDVSTPSVSPEVQLSRTAAGKALVVGCHVPLPSMGRAVVQLSSSVAIALPDGATP